MTQKIISEVKTLEKEYNDLIRSISKIDRNSGEYFGLQIEKEPTVIKVKVNKLRICFLMLKKKIKFVQ